MGPGPGVPAIVPSSGPCSGTSFPPRGPVGPVPPLPRYYEVLRLLSVLPAALRCLRLAVPHVRRFFAPTDERRAADGPGVWSSVPRPISREETTRSPRSLGNPLAYMPCSSTPARSRCPASSAPRCSLPLCQPRRLSQPRVLRGSIPRPARSLCTLRSRDHSRTTQHSVPAGGQPLPGGTGYPQSSTKVSAITNHPWRPPPPGFPGALTNPAGERSGSVLPDDRRRLERAPRRPRPRLAAPATVT